MTNLDTSKENPTTRRRRGSARADRLARRSASNKAPVVKPGQAGGFYKPLTDAQCDEVFEASLTILETIGMANPNQQLTELALAKGASLDNEGRLLFPRKLIEEMIDISCKEFMHHAPNSKYDMHYANNKVHFSTAGEAPTVLDYNTRKYRPSTAIDQYDFARLADQLEHLHCFDQTVIATEYGEDVYAQDINILYALLAGTEKPISVSTCTASHVDDFIRMMDIHLGKEGEFLKRPFLTTGGCPIVSPLRFGTENLEVLIKCAEVGMVYDMAIASQSGSTAPAALAGALAQTFAEGLAALTAVNLVKPGMPFLVGTWPMVSDLRTGAMCGGSGEQALLSSASAQMSAHIGLLSSTSACMSDSKWPDAQSGYEKGITSTLVAMAGANYIGESAGMMGSLIGCSLEAMVIDNDMIGNIQRALRGIEINKDTLSIDVIRDCVTGNGPGHFLNHGQTLELMETEYLYPTIADRNSTDDWEKAGSKDIAEVAHEKVKDMLKDYYPEYIAPKTDAKIREAFPQITIKPEDLKAGNGRW